MLAMTKSGSEDCVDLMTEKIQDNFIAVCTDVPNWPSSLGSRSTVYLSGRIK